jgi:hypothetical protein
LSSVLSTFNEILILAAQTGSGQFAWSALRANVAAHKKMPLYGGIFFTVKSILFL